MVVRNERVVYPLVAVIVVLLVGLGKMLFGFYSKKKCDFLGFWAAKYCIFYCKWLMLNVQTFGEAESGKEEEKEKNVVYACLHDRTKRPQRQQVFFFFEFMYMAIIKLCILVGFFLIIQTYFMYLMGARSIFFCCFHSSATR